MSCYSRVLIFTQMREGKKKKKSRTGVLVEMTETQPTWQLRKLSPHLG